MSRTRRLVDYKDGKPIRTTNEGQHMPYRFYKHERTKVRKHLNRSKRHHDRIRFKKYGVTPGNDNTNGWRSW